VKNRNINTGVIASKNNIVPNLVSYEQTAFSTDCLTSFLLHGPEKRGESYFYYERQPYGKYSFIASISCQLAIS